MSKFYKYKNFFLYRLLYRPYDLSKVRIWWSIQIKMIRWVSNRICKYLNIIVNLEYNKAMSKIHLHSASVRKNYMKLRTDLAAQTETVLEESGIDISPVRDRVPEELKQDDSMKKLLDQCMNEAYR